MILQRIFKACLCAVVFASLILGQEGFHWEWRQSEYLQQTLREAKIPAPDRNAIAKIISGVIGPYGPSMKFLGIESEQKLDDEVLDTRVKMVDLNGDGILEIIAQGSGRLACGATGNCLFWVFQKVDCGYRVLVSLNGVQTVQVQRSSSNRFKDIVVEMHNSATQRVLTLMRYSEGKYHQAGCYYADWDVLEGDPVRGKVVHLKEPRLTPCSQK